MFSIALGLIFLSVGEGGTEKYPYKLSELQELLKTITHPIGVFTSHLVVGYAFAGSGNVLQVQKMMSVCAETNRYAAEKEKDEAEKEEGKAGRRLRCGEQEWSRSCEVVVPLGRVVGYCGWHKCTRHTTLPISLLRLSCCCCYTVFTVRGQYKYFLVLSSR